MAQELSWKDAIKAVLASAKSPMHYTDIVEEIAKRGLKNYRGATPANTVAAQISTSIKDEGAESPFVRLGPGLYALKGFATSTIISTAPDELETDSELSAPAGLVNAFGMFWDRSKVNWTSRPALYGQQPESTQKTDFSDQKGVYLLYDGREVVYVGRVTDSTLGKRLLVHTTDRLNG